MASQAIGIDIGSHAVKIAVVQRKGGGSRALRLFRAPLGGDTDNVRIQGALKRAGIAGGPALIGISGRDLIIRYTHVPPVPDWRLKLLMQFEINEVSGQSGEEVAADYRRLNLPVESDEETVLVSLARNRWLSPRLDAARAAGLKADGGCPCSVAAFNAFLAHGEWAEGETTYLVNIGRENIDMAIQRDGELLFARNMSGGGHMFTEAIMNTFGLKEPKSEKNKVQKGDLTPKAKARYPDATSEKLANAMQGPAGQLVSMIQSSIMICRAQTKITDLNIDKLVLSGGTASMKGIKDYFAANMSVPVELFDPTEAMDLSALDAQDQQELGQGHDFSVAVGLAETLLQPDAFRLEVLTESEKKKRYFVQRTIWALAAAAAALLLVVMLFNTRASGIEEWQEANKQVELNVGQRKKEITRQERAIKAENDARKKDVALRARRLSGMFTRTILAVLPEAEHLFLYRFKMESQKQSLDLQGRPTKARSAMDGEGSGGDTLHDQHVWPEVVVDGMVQKEYTPNPGQTLNAYYTAVGAALSKLKVEGWPIDMETTSLDRKNRFTMTFRLNHETKGEG